MMVLTAGAFLAGCGQQAPVASPPAPDSVVVNSVCAGVKQAYWHGSWWVGFSGPLQHMAGNGPMREITGTMVATGPGAARLESSDLRTPQTMADTPDTGPGVPPLPCGLNAPA